MKGRMEVTGKTIGFVFVKTETLTPSFESTGGQTLFPIDNVFFFGWLPPRRLVGQIPDGILTDGGLSPYLYFVKRFFSPRPWSKEGFLGWLCSVSGLNSKSVSPVQVLTPTWSLLDRRRSYSSKRTHFFVVRWLYPLSSLVSLWDGHHVRMSWTTFDSHLTFVTVCMEVVRN